MPHECEVAKVLSIDQAIPARAAIRTLNESEFLIEADRVHADAGQLRGLTDVNRVSHAILKINPGVKSRVKKNLRKPNRYDGPPCELKSGVGLASRTVAGV